VPRQLVDLLGREKVLDREELQFERDLANLTGGGFLYGRRFGYPPLLEPAELGSPSRESIQQKKEDEKRTTRIAEMIESLDGDSEVAEKRRQLLDRQSEKFNSEIVGKQAAYVGWLITNKTFRAECDLLWEHWNKEVEKAKRFPYFPLSLMGDEPTPDPTFSRECAAAFDFFYRRWGLESFVTWHLPLPMRPEVNHLIYAIGQDALGQAGTKTAARNAMGLGNAGLVLFLPWCMLREKRISIRDLVLQGGQWKAVNHVAEWLQLDPQHNKNWGPKRCALMLRIYRYVELALKSRYGESERWVQEKVDRAFGMLADPHTGKPFGEENVRKTRQYLQRRRDEVLEDIDEIVKQALTSERAAQVLVTKQPKSSRG
jgi:hypothetical protein